MKKKLLTFMIIVFSLILCGCFQNDASEITNSYSYSQNESEIDAFNLLSPYDNQVVNEVPIFNWEKANNAETYTLEIASSSNFSSEDMLQKQMEKTRKILTTNSETGVVVEGLPNPQIKLGSCCYPIPGDEIIGYITKGNGIVVHRCDCNNLKNLGLERTIHLDWATNISRKYPTCIRVSAMQKDTLIGDLMTCINSLGLSIASINAVNTPDLQTIVKLKVLTSNLNELNNLIVNMKKIEAVHNIERDNQ